MFSEMAARLAGLRGRYGEPHRAYHGQAHIDAMLRGLRALGGTVDHIPAMELAIWYHDAIYDPTAQDNEARSADLLQTEMTGLVDPALLVRADLMIRLTALHRLPAEIPEPWRADCAAFLDLDLAVLGADPARYDAYEQGIAAEYVPVHGPALFRRGRRQFLEGFLQRPRLFLTDAAHQELDAPARQNLARALAALT